METNTEQMTFEQSCEHLMAAIKRISIGLLKLKCHKVFATPEDYVGQHEEMNANIMLAYRRLEEAEMRFRKLLQHAKHPQKKPRPV